MLAQSRDVPQAKDRSNSQLRYVNVKISSENPFAKICKQ